MCLVCISFSDFLTLVDIIVTSVIGVWIATIVQSNLENNRSVKAYFINENTDMKNEYRSFVDKLYGSKVSGNYIVEWFKVMSIKINTFDTYIADQYNVSSGLLELHNEFKKKLTEKDDFNDSFGEESVRFTSETRSMVLVFHQKLSELFTENILNITKAKKSSNFKRIYYWIAGSYK